MIWNRLVLAGIAVLAAVVVIDALRQDEPETRALGDFRIDLATSRDGTWHPVTMLRQAFPGRTPSSLAISKVAVAPDEVVAVGVSHVPGDRPAAAAIELWDGDRLLASFSVPPGSFARGLWFAAHGKAIATIGLDERGYVYGRDGKRLRGTAYFAYETG